MKSNKFWITTTLALIGISVFLLNELHTVDKMAEEDIVACQDAMIGIAMKSANFSCINTVEYMCNRQVDCSSVSIEQIKQYCENFRVE